MLAVSPETTKIQTLNTEDIKKLLDNQILGILSLSNQITSVKSAIDLVTTDVYTSLNYNATFISGNKTYVVLENLLQSIGKTENQTTFYQKIIDNNGTFNWDYLGTSKSTSSNKNIFNNDRSNFVFRNNSETKHMNYTASSTVALDSKETLTSEIETCDNFTGRYYRSIVTPISSSNEMLATIDPTAKSYSLTVIDERGICASTSFALGTLPPNAIDASPSQSSTNVLNVLDTPTISPTLADEVVISGVTNAHGHTWLVAGGYIYWSDVLNGQINWSLFISGIFITLINFIATNIANALLGLGVSISVGAFLAAAGPVVGVASLAIPLMIEVATCFPADVGGEYNDMSIFYFEFGFVFLTSTFGLPCYVEEGFYSNHWRYPEGEIQDVNWTYFDAFDTAEGPLYQIYSWFTGASNHESMIPNNLPCLLDPYVTINSYDEGSNSYFNAVPITINGQYCGDTCSTIFLPPGEYTIDFPSFNGALDCIDVDGSTT